MNRDRHRWWVLALAGSAAVIALPTVCGAHSIHPVYYGLGPLPFLVPFSNPQHVPKVIVCCLMFAAVIAVQSVVLRFTIPRKATGGNTWRACLTFVVGRMTETGSLICLAFAGQGLLPQLAWSLDSWEVVYVLPVMAFSVGVLVTAGLIWLLYRRERLSKWRTISVAALLSSASYALLQVTVFWLLKVQWVY